MQKTIEFFGTKAGKIWEALRDGPKTMTQLQKVTGMTQKEVCMGLGWLAREGKIVVMNLEGMHLKFQLTE